MYKIFFLPFYMLLQHDCEQTFEKHDTIKVVRTLNNFQGSIDDFASIYISRLNCNSVTISTTYISKLVLDSLVQRLINLTDKNLNQLLLKNIDDTSKTLAIHIILTKRLKPQNGTFNTNYIYDNAHKKITRVNFIYNKLTWYSDLNEGTQNCFHIDKDEIHKVNHYWSDQLNIESHKNNK